MRKPTHLVSEVLEVKAVQTQVAASSIVCFLLMATEMRIGMGS